MKLSKFNIIIPVENKDNYILFNTLSGNTFLLDEENKSKVENNQISELKDELKKEFVEKKVLLEDDIDENKYFQYFQNKAKFTNNSLTLTILLTWACNLRCVYCYEGAGEKKSYSMTKETADSIIAFVKKEIEQKSLKIVSIFLFGGEPLVNYKIGEYILEELHSYCDEKKVQFVSAIITNATLLNADIIKSLVKHNCKYVQVTLDGVKDIHDQRRIAKDGSGTFDIILNSLRLLRDSDKSLNPIIRVNIDKTNIGDIDDLLEVLKEEKLTSLNIDFGIVRGGTQACSSYESKCYEDEELGSLMNTLWKKAEAVGFKMGGSGRPFRKWTYCGLDCDSSYTIEPNGDVYKCWEHAGEEEHKMGTIHTDGYIDKLTYNFFQWMTKSPLNVEACSNCAYLPVCGGGCGSISFNDAKKYEAEGCFKIKGIVEEQVKRCFKNATVANS